MTPGETLAHQALANINHVTSSHVNGALLQSSDSVNRALVFGRNTGPVTLNCCKHCKGEVLQL